jgi:sugar transferase (PEP-CTERM/EpsH1 system associated)
VATARQPNVLLVAHRVPHPPDKGDRIRTFHLLRFLARRAQVHLACLADEPVPPASVAVLRRYCTRLAIVPVRGGLRWATILGSLARGRTATEGAFRSAALTRLLREWAGEVTFDAAVASSSGVAQFLRVPVLRGVPTVVDLVDVDSQKWFDYSAASRPPWSWLYRLEGRRLRELERSIAGAAQAVTLVSEAEADLFRGVAPAAEVHAVTNGVDLDYFRPQIAVTEGGCVFTGALDYRPNVDAACWFCTEVWPEVRRRHPDARLSLVGRRPGREILRLGGVPGVEVVGQVPDVRPYLAVAAVAVVPLRIARGLQNKVLEAMAMGRPVVASPQALGGFGAPSCVPAVKARSIPEWVSSVSRLLRDSGLRRELGAAGRRYAEAHHDWGRCLEPFGSLLGLAPDRAKGADTDRGEPLATGMGRP